MESQPQNPEFRNNPENFHPCNPGYTHQTISNQTLPTVSKVLKESVSVCQNRTELNTIHAPVPFKLYLPASKICSKGYFQILSLL